MMRTFGWLCLIATSFGLVLAGAALQARDGASEPCDVAAVLIRPGRTTDGKVRCSSGHTASISRGRVDPGDRIIIHQRADDDPDRDDWSDTPTRDWSIRDPRLFRAGAGFLIAGILAGGVAIAAARNAGHPL